MSASGTQYHRRKAAGVCVDCAGPVARAHRCASCHDARIRCMREYRERKRIEAMEDPPSNECLCGEPKAWIAECCERCEYLDGRTGLESDVIAALRGTDGMGLSELSQAVGRYSSISTGRRALLRAVQSLIAAGRARRYWCHGDARIVTSRMFGRELAERNIGSDGYWVYALDGLTEREWKRRAA